MCGASRKVSYYSEKSAPIDVRVNSLEFVDSRSSDSAWMEAASLPAADANAYETSRGPCVVRPGRRCQCGVCHKGTIAPVLGGIRLPADDSDRLIWGNSA